MTGGLKSRLFPGLDNRRPAVLGAVGALIGALALLLLAVGAFDASSEEDAAPAGATATVEQLTSRPASFFRRPVVFAARVSEVLGAHAVVVGGRELGGGDPLLVVSEEPIAALRDEQRPGSVLENDLVVVRGRLRVLDNELYRRLTEKQPGPGLERFDGEPVMVAEELEVAPQLFPIRDSRSIEELLATPERFLGRLVAVDGRITRVGESTFVLDRRLAVLVPPRMEGRLPEVGSRVRVAGAVRRLDPDQARRAAGGALDEALFGELGSRPIIRAESIDLRG